MKAYAVIFEHGGEGQENWELTSLTYPDAPPPGTLPVPEPTTEVERVAVAA